MPCHKPTGKLYTSNPPRGMKRLTFLSEDEMVELSAVLHRLTMDILSQMFPDITVDEMIIMDEIMADLRAKIDEDLGKK